MLNLIKLELYKLSKQRVFKLLLLTVIALSAFSAFSEFRIQEASDIMSTGKLSYANAFLDIFMLFVVAIFAGFFIGSDFTNKTIQAQLANGHSRLDILVSKAIIFFMGTALLMILYPVTVCLISTIKFGFGEPFTIASVVYLLRLAILGTLLNMGTTSIYVLIGFICQDVPKTICVCSAFPLVFSALNSILKEISPIFAEILNFSTLAQLSEIVRATMTPQAAITVVSSAAVTATIMLGLSYWSFAKSEVK